MSHVEITNEKRRQLFGAMLVVTMLPGCGGGSGADAAVVSSSKPELPTQASIPASDPTLSLSNMLGAPIYIAHRGSAAVFPEETFTAYDGSLANGDVILEADIQMLADGTLVVMHDLTVDRTTTSSGNVKSLTRSEWEKLVVDANVWHGSNYGNSLPALLFSEWLDRYKKRAIFVPEDKDGKSMSAMLNAFTAAGITKDQVLVQCFSLAPLLAATAAGYSAIYLHSGTAEPESITGTGIRWVGIDANAPDANIQRWLASDTKVIIWSVNRRFLRDIKLKLGVHGFFSDDPTYLKSNLPLSTTDRFKLQTWVPGMLANLLDYELLWRGTFFPDDYWGYATTGLGYLGCMHGYLCPIKGLPNPSSYEIEFRITFDSAGGNDQGRWASIFIAVDDQPFVDSGTDNTAGYHILFRKNGGIHIFKKASGFGPISLENVLGQQIADGQEVSYRITVTDTTVNVARLGLDRKPIYAVTAYDATTRGAYLHLGRNGLACRFRNLAII